MMNKINILIVAVLLTQSCSKTEKKPDWEITYAQWEIDTDHSNSLSTYTRLHLKCKNNTNKTANYVSLLAKLVKEDGTTVKKVYYTAPHPSIATLSVDIEPNEEHDFFDLGCQGFYGIELDQYEQIKNLHIKYEWTIEYD